MLHVPVNKDAVKMEGTDNASVIASINAGNGAVLVGTVDGDVVAAAAAAAAAAADDDDDDDDVVEDNSVGAGFAGAGAGAGANSGQKRVAACVGDFAGEPHLVTLSAGPTSSSSSSPSTTTTTTLPSGNDAAAAATPSPTPTLQEDASPSTLPPTPRPPITPPPQPNSQIAVGIDSMGLFRVVRLDGTLALLGTGDGKCRVPAPAVPDVSTPEDATPRSKRKRKEEAAAAAAAAAELPPGTTNKVDVVVSTALSNDQQYMAVSSQSGVYLYDLTETGWLDPPPPETDEYEIVDENENDSEVLADKEAESGESGERDGDDDDDSGGVVAAATEPGGAAGDDAEAAPDEEDAGPPPQPTLVFQVQAPAQPPTPNVSESFFGQVKAICISESPQPTELGSDAAAAAAAAATAGAEAEQNKAKSKKGGKSTPDGDAVAEAASVTAALVAAAEEAAADAEQVNDAKRVMTQFHNVDDTLVLSVAWKDDNQLRWMPVVTNGAEDDVQSETKTVFSRAAISACAGNGTGTVAVGMVDGSVSVYDMHRHELLACFQNGASAVVAIAFTSAGVLVVGGADGEVTLYNVSKKKQVSVDLSLLNELPDNGADLTMGNAVAAVASGPAGGNGAETVLITQENGRIVEIDPNTGIFLSLHLIPAPWLANPGSLVVDSKFMFVQAKLYGDDSSSAVFRFQLAASVAEKEEDEGVEDGGEEGGVYPLGMNPVSFANVKSNFVKDLDSNRAARQARMLAALERV